MIEWLLSAPRAIKTQCEKSDNRIGPYHVNLNYASLPLQEALHTPANSGHNRSSPLFLSEESRNRTSSSIHRIMRMYNIINSKKPLKLLISLW